MSYSENDNLSVISVLTSKDWQRICLRFGDTWKAICKKYGVQKADADDFIQQAFLTAIHREQVGKFIYESDIKTSSYIARAVHNLIMNHKKVRRNESLNNNSEFLSLSEDELLQPLQKIIKDEANKRKKKLTKHLKEAFKQLSDNEKEVIILRFYNGKKLREIKEEIGWPIPTIQKRLNRAIEKLGKKIAPRRV